MSYVDLNTIHNPATGTVAPASWGDQIRENLEFLIDPPAVSVFHSTTQSVTDATWTTLSANSENYDNDSMHSTVTNNSRITIQTAGRYNLFMTVRFAPNTAGYRGTGFLVNGTTAIELTTVQAAPVASTILSAVATLVLTATNYVEVQCRQNTGGNLNATLAEFGATYLTR